MLFILFTDDPSFYFHAGDAFLFADDYKIFDSFPQSKLDLNPVENDLSFISDFCQKVQMQVLVNKCQVLTLNSGQND